MSERPAKLPVAKVAAKPQRRWLGWAIAAAMIPPGWLLIGHANRWHLTAPVIVLGLGWLALVGAGYTLVRAANATVEPVDGDWFSAVGSRDELEREKRNLIRAIKDVEFDRDTGKVSDVDAKLQIDMFRARAIEVIKALDSVGAQTPRERILAELAARAQVDKVAGKRKAGKGGKGGKAGKAKAEPPAKPAADEVSAPESAAAEAPASASNATEPAEEGASAPDPVLPPAATAASAPAEEAAS